MTLKQLVKESKGRVYVYLANQKIGQRFLEDLEREGFTFADGAKPTERGLDSIYALNRNMTINFVGFAGHMAFGCSNSVGGQRLIKVDYWEFLKKQQSEKYHIKADRQKKNGSQM